MVDLTRRDGPDADPGSTGRGIARARAGRAVLFVAVLVLAAAAAYSRALPGGMGDVVVRVSLVAAVSGGVLGVLLARSSASLALAAVAGALLVPSIVASATTAAYPGIQGLSSADIQFLRAIEHIQAGLPLGAPGARVTLYPTSFVFAATLAEATGLSPAAVIEWSWVVALPVSLLGWFAFAKELTGSWRIGAFAAVVGASDPWLLTTPLYDGFNMALIPTWAYLTVKMLRREGSVPTTALALVVTAAIVTSHLFTSLFLLPVGAGLGLAVALPEVGRWRPRVALQAIVRATALPLAMITAFAVYLAAEYVREGASLATVLLNALESVPVGPTTFGATRLPSTLLALLLSALLAYALFAMAGLRAALLSGSTTARISVLTALPAAPIVLFAVLAPPQFASGTDLTEWKVRPLFGAFLLVSPLVGTGVSTLLRGWPRTLGALLATTATAVVLANSIALPTAYGGAGPRVFTTDAPPRVVEDTSITPYEYRALGDYVRSLLPGSPRVLADWHQSNWMVGTGGIQRVPDYTASALFDETALGKALREHTYDAIAADANLADYRSLYLPSQPTDTWYERLAASGLLRVFDSGTQVLYVSPGP